MAKAKFSEILEISSLIKEKIKEFTYYGNKKSPFDKAYIDN